MAAVEFSIVCLPFLVLLFGIVQTGFTIWAQQNLDYRLETAVRSVFTGQFQIANSGQASATILLAALKTNMCGTTSAPVTTVFDCSGIKIDLTLGTTFAASQAPTPLDPATRSWATGFGTHYSCAAPGSIVIATAAVKFVNLLGLLNAGFSDFSDGSALLQSTAVFRTEPYQVLGTSGC